MRRVSERLAGRIQAKGQSKSEDRGDRLDPAEWHRSRSAAFDAADLSPRTGGRTSDGVLTQISVQASIAQLAADLAQMLVRVASATVAAAVDRGHDESVAHGSYLPVIRVLDRATSNRGADGADEARSALRSSNDGIAARAVIAHARFAHQTTIHEDQSADMVPVARWTSGDAAGEPPPVPSTA